MNNMTPIARALLSLRGLSIGDAVGETMFGAKPQELSDRRVDRPAPWRWTDDTAMAASIVETLAACGEIVEDELAARFLRRYARDPARGYGAGAHRILSAMGEGVPWREAAGAVFGGQGSAGNGGAMRAAPIGAYHAGNIAAAVADAARSAAPTHAHPEGAAGAIALAALSAAVWGGERDPGALILATIEATPAGDTRRRLTWVADHLSDDALTVAATVGNGGNVLASDTVPFAAWCAIRHLGAYAEAIWTCAAVGGDIDTTCAMVGGMIIGVVGEAGIPTAWRDAVEPLP